MEGFYAFREALILEMNRDAEAIADGGVSSWEDYQKRVGVRKGIKRALTILEDMARKLEDDSDT